MHICSTAPVLVESTDSRSVVSDPVNVVWLGLVRGIDGLVFELIARCYYLALHHFRSCSSRPVVPGVISLCAADKQQAQRELHQQLRAQRSDDDTFVPIGVDPDDKTIPLALRDPSHAPPRLRDLLDGPGAPPIDALCLMRAFLVAPLLDITDSPQSVHLALHSNPTLARACGFAGPDATKQPGEFTTRRLPSLSACEQFNDVMSRYGLWHRARQAVVRGNLDSGVLQHEDSLAFDTTHVESNSHCDNLLPQDAQAQLDAGKKVKHFKVERVRKHCDCGKDNWPNCPHPWVSTDQGAAVVVKGPTRVYWAHKASVASFGDSEIPIDVRVLNYAAHSDSKTLLPHLTLLNSDMPDVVERLRVVLADSAYSCNANELAQRYPNIRLSAPIIQRKCAGTENLFAGIDHFTATGVPVCQAGHRFELRGRDLADQRFIWVAPDDEHELPVCSSCPMKQGCLTKGSRRNIRVERQLTPQIDWDHPQHFRTEKAIYGRRTGVERAIKRIKVDLDAQCLPYRDAYRVQAFLDRKLLTLHLLLKIQALAG
jgi:hypothetical protein